MNQDNKTQFPHGHKTTNIKDAWEERQILLGNSKRTVLFKNLPNYFNNRIHKLHINFIQNALDENTKNILDVGCGYGRIAKDLLVNKRDLQFDGIELSTNFAKHYEENYGSCFQGPLENFIPKKKYDAILIITVLMYIDKKDLRRNLKKIWKSLNRKGVLVCIEPIENIFITLRMKLKLSSLEPTGKSKVNYFDRTVFKNLFNFPDAAFKSESTIGLLPIINRPSLHKAITITKL